MSRQWCRERGRREGSGFQDITPRFGVAWDVLARQDVHRVEYGQVPDGGRVSGNYTATNVAGHTIDAYQRAWTDLNGDRRVNCDLEVPLVAPNSDSFPSNGECGAVITGPGTANNTARRFGRQSGRAGRG